MTINLLEKKKMHKYQIEDWLTWVKNLDDNFMLASFRSFSLQYIDSGGTHIIRYSDSFEESKSAVIHQLKKILKYPQNYDDVLVCAYTTMFKYTKKH